MKQIVDIPFTSIDSVELFLNKFRYSISQVAAQAQARPQGLCGHWRDHR